MKDRFRRFQAAPEIVLTVKNAKALRQAIADENPVPETVVRAAALALSLCIFVSAN